MSSATAEAIDPDALYEVVDGVWVEVPPMGARNTMLAKHFAELIDRYLATHPLGRTTIEAVFVLDPVRDLRRRPDTAFLSFERWPVERLWPEEDWPVVPDIAIEVLSPHDTQREINRKTLEYFTHGVREVWHVNPVLRDVTVRDAVDNPRAFGERDEVVSAVLPGLAVRAGEFFPREARS